jgi:MYXO-CTERM domain-containing protein
VVAELGVRPANVVQGAGFAVPVPGRAVQGKGPFRPVEGLGEPSLVVEDPAQVEMHHRLARRLVEFGEQLQREPEMPGGLVVPPEPSAPAWPASWARISGHPALAQAGGQQLMTLTGRAKPATCVASPPHEAAAGALTLCGAGGRRRRIGSVQYQRDRLIPEERESLDRDGYLVIPALLEEPVIAPMRARLDELIHDTIVAWDADPDTGNAHSWVVEADLGLTDPDFAPLREHPLVADAVAAVLGPDAYLRGLALRAPLPGMGHQGLHPDFDEPRGDGMWRSLSAMWCISEFTGDNGPLRIIPGSHRTAGSPVDALPLGFEMGPHLDEVRILAPAGSLILFDAADIWHSGTFNYSPAPRLAVTANFDPCRPVG